MVDEEEFDQVDPLVDKQHLKVESLTVATSNNTNKQRNSNNSKKSPKKSGGSTPRKTLTGEDAPKKKKKKKISRRVTPNNINENKAKHPTKKKIKKSVKTKSKNSPQLNGNNSREREENITSNSSNPISEEDFDEEFDEYNSNKNENLYSIDSPRQLDNEQFDLPPIPSYSSRISCNLLKINANFWKDSEKELYSNGIQHSSFHNSSLNSVLIDDPFDEDLYLFSSHNPHFSSKLPLSNPINIHFWKSTENDLSNKTVEIPSNATHSLVYKNKNIEKQRSNTLPIPPNNNNKSNPNSNQNQNSNQKKNNFYDF